MDHLKKLKEEEKEMQQIIDIVECGLVKWLICYLTILFEGLPAPSICDFLLCLDLAHNHCYLSLQV